MLTLRGSWRRLLLPVLLLLLLLLLPALFVWHWPSLGVWLMVIGIGLLAALAHLMMTRASRPG